MQDRANALLRAINPRRSVSATRRAQRAATSTSSDYVAPYVGDLPHVIDMDAIRAARLKIGVDPLGGAARAYWEPIADATGSNSTVVNPQSRPHLRVHDVDHDGKIRMDCSSPTRWPAWSG